MARAALSPILDGGSDGEEARRTQGLDRQSGRGPQPHAGTEAAGHEPGRDRRTAHAPDEKSVVGHHVLAIHPDALPDAVGELVSVGPQVAKLKVIAAKCPVHRTLDGEVMFNERVEQVG